MRKIIAAVLALVVLLSLAAPIALAATEPTAADTTAEVLATSQMNLYITMGVVAVLAIGFIVLIIVKKKALLAEQ